MRFAVVGDSAEAAPLAQAVQQCPDHTIGACFATGSLLQELTRRTVVTELVASDEEAVMHPEADCVIVAWNDADQSIHAVRRASQEDKHVIVIPPEKVSTAFNFELHLLLDESSQGIIPLTGRWYVSNGDGSDYVNQHQIRQVSFTLPLSEDQQLQRARQVRLLDAVAGLGYRYSQVTGLDVPGPNESVLSRTITLASSQHHDSNATTPPAIITFESTSSARTAPLNCVAVNGQQYTIPTMLPDPVQTEGFPQPQDLLKRLAHQLGDSTACQAGMEQFSNTLELEEALQKSLRRRRTVDVHFDGISERAVFKTQMTAIGCGVLAYVAFGMIAFLVVAQVFDLPPIVLQIGRILWIAPVVMFLFAQLLLPLARERSSQPQIRNNTKEDQ